MKKSAFLLAICLFFLPLTACFHTTEYPNMKEYSQEEVLQVAAEKYNVRQYLFPDRTYYLYGEVDRDEDGIFRVQSYTSTFSVDFINGDNIENAMTAFAGKNGPHDVQMTYRNFLCHIAIADTDNGAKYIYYNTNIQKDADLVDTIGASDYSFDTLPTEVTQEVFSAPDDWQAMRTYLQSWQESYTHTISYSRERLTFTRPYRDQGVEEIELYKENGKIVFDLYYQSVDDPDRQFVYSSSDRYVAVHASQQQDLETYMTVSYTVSPSQESPSCDLLKGTVKIKEIDGTLVYTRFRYRAQYYVLHDNKPVLHESTETIVNTYELEKGYLLEKIDGIDHTTAADFFVMNCYLFYLKR